MQWNLIRDTIEITSEQRVSFNETLLLLTSDKGQNGQKTMGLKCVTVYNIMSNC